jgi:hypothetical protein
MSPNDRTAKDNASKGSNCGTQRLRIIEPQKTALLHDQTAKDTPRKDQTAKDNVSANASAKRAISALAMAHASP